MKVKGEHMKLNHKRTLIVGLAFMSISGFWQLYDFIIPLMMKTEFNIADTYAGVVMSLDNILALILLPYFGRLSDNTKTKMGRRMPFIIIGTIIASMAMLLLPYAAQHGSIKLFIIGLGVLLLSLASYRSPAVALMPDITIKPLRSMGNAIINLMGAVGGVIVLGLIALLPPEKIGSYYPIFISVSALMLGALLVMVVFVKENKWALEASETTKSLHIEEHEDLIQEKGSMGKEVKRSMIFLLVSISLWFMGYNAVISAFSRYATIHLDFSASQASMILLIANVAAIIGFIPIGKLSSKYGRKKMILLGLIVLGIAFGTAGLYQAYSPLMFINFILAGLSWATISVNSLPMVLEMSSEAEVGRFTGLYYSFSMAAQIITPILSGLLFDLIDYSILFPYAFVFIVLAFFTMSKVKHGDSVITNEL